MITFLNGRVVEKQPTRAVLDVGGVGYELFIPLSSFDRLPAVGDLCRVLTHDHIREDAHVLFGFISEGERRMFELLLSVGGVGPKTALAALSGLSVRELKAAIAQGDVKRLTSISGVGRKIAERMIVDLRDKLSKGEALEAVAGVQELDESDIKLRDAVMALISLGYKQVEARKMVADIVADKDGARLTVGEIVKKALGGG
jgi:Holliday junction DNA helicase RuvA